MSVLTTRVQRLEIKNFRGIQSLALDFEGNITVLVGVNGVGKTSVLEALRFLLDELVSTVLEVVEGGPTVIFHGGRRRLEEGILRKEDIRLGSKSMALLVSALIESQPIEWNVEANIRAGSGNFHLGVRHPVLRSFAEELFRREAHPRGSWPLAIYYSLGKGSGQKVDLPDEDVGMTQRWAYDGALSGAGIASLEQFVDWFRRLEDYENEKRTEDSAFRDNQLQAVRDVVGQILPGFNALRIRRQPVRMVIRKNQVELEISHLSDGERYLLALGSDIARRLALANPTADKAHLCSAIVLIDEVETHLHPSWQRRVVPSLVRAFPNCQFIIATHSPQVLSNVKPESIYVLNQEDGEIRVTHPEASFGRDSNRILEDLMGVDERPSEVKAKLGDYFRLIDEGKTEEAQVLRRELEASIGSSDPEFTRADVLLHTRELLSR